MQQISARDVSPTIAIEIGYSMFLVDCVKPETALWRSAKAAVDHFEAITRSFAESTPEGVYFLTLRLAANSLARGISRRKRTLAERIAGAREEKQSMIAKLAQTERLIGILKGGLQILLIGGFGYMLMHLFLQRPEMREEAKTPEQRNFTSLAFALGVALIGSFVKSKLMTHRILKVFDHYNEKITRANKEYVDSVIQEYRFAAQTAELAWEQYTREKAPVTPGFESLLIGIMGGDDERIESALAPEEPMEEDELPPAPAPAPADVSRQPAA